MFCKVIKMGIDMKVGAEQSRAKNIKEETNFGNNLIKYLEDRNMSAISIYNALRILEKNQQELKKDIKGRYYQGCCI